MVMARDSFFEAGDFDDFYAAVLVSPFHTG